MKNPALIGVVIIIGAVILWAVMRNTATENTNTQNSNTNTSANTNTAGNANTNSSTNVTTSGSLELTTPANNATVTSPFEVSGKSSASSVTINIKKADGATVISLPSTVRNGTFNSNVTFAFSSTTEGEVEVVQSDGTTVSATVTFEVPSTETE